MIKRYSLKTLEKIFSDKNKYEKWLEVEKAALKYLSKKGVFSQTSYHEMVSDFVIVPKFIREEEKRTNHDVVAFVNYISSITSSPNKKWIHYGLTSSDVVDTANGLLLKEANEEMLGYAYELLNRIKQLSLRHKETFMLKRENGSIEGITSFGYELALYYEELKNGIDLFEKHRKHVECASISGSVGISSHIGPDIQDFVALELGLHSAQASTQVLSRDRYYKYFSLLNSMVQTINNLSVDLRLLSRTEIREVSEAFYKDQIGSSSLPHKRNPISLENICGLARLFRGYASTTSKGISLWFERDISHSSTDRVVFVDAITTASQIFKRMFKILRHIAIFEETMDLNIRKNDFAAYKSYVKRALVEHSKHSEAEVNLFIEDLRKSMNNKEISFKEAFGETNLSTFIGKETIETLFNPRHQMSYLDTVYRRIFGEANQLSNFDYIFHNKAKILNAIDLLAMRLNYTYKYTGTPVNIVAFREGSILFLSQLLTKLTFPLHIQTVNLYPQRYAENAKKAPEINIDFDAPIKGRHVLILDEFVRTGKTVNIFKDYLKKFKPENIRVATLFAVNKEEILKSINFFGLLIPDLDNVAGFGMDIKGMFRNIPAVGKIKVENIPSI